MQRILSNSLAVLLTVVPLLSLKSGGRTFTYMERVRRENEGVRNEIRKTTAQIRLVDDMIIFKDSVDARNVGHHNNFSTTKTK